MAITHCHTVEQVPFIKRQLASTQLTSELCVVLFSSRSPPQFGGHTTLVLRRAARLETDGTDDKRAPPCPKTKVHQTSLKIGRLLVQIFHKKAPATPREGPLSRLGLADLAQEGGGRRFNLGEQ